MMHACLERADPEVVSLLLKSEADPSLQDHSNCSALVYAITSDDRETLKVLLNACRAQGKEVIIITLDKSASGRQKTKQYLNMPPAHLEECHSPTACICPSEIELKTFRSSLASSDKTEKAFFSFKELDHPRSMDDPSQIVLLMRKSSLTKARSRLSQMQRPQSEPWIKSSLSLFHQNKITSLHKGLQDITPQEQLSSKTTGLAPSNRFITRHQSIDIKDTSHLLKTFEQSGSKKLLYDKINSQIPCVEEKHNPSGIPVGKDASLGQISFTSNLNSVIQKRNLGANYYSSDSQLTTSMRPSAAEDSKSVIGKKKIFSPSHSSLQNPREVLQNMCPSPLTRKNKASLERQESGALLLDHIAQTRPGFLPPLNVSPHPPVPDITLINRVSGMISCGQKYLVLAAPVFPRKTKNMKILLRRQSLQTEQIKQLVNY